MKRDKPRPGALSKQVHWSVRPNVGKCHKGEIHGHMSNFSKENHTRSQASHNSTTQY